MTKWTRGKSYQQCKIKKLATLW